MSHYRHTQFGTLVSALLFAVMLFEFGLAFVIGWHPILIGSVALMALLLLAFHSLTIEVTREQIRARFGWSPFGRTFSVTEIRDARIVKNRWYYGWGIRFTPHGWLYNISGLDAVEIEFRNGKKVRLGTDEPDELLRVIRQGAKT